jgi:hypothetical protein
VDAALHSGLSVAREQGDFSCFASRFTLLALFQMLDLLMHMMDCVVSQAGRLNDCNKDSTRAFI